MPEYDATIEYRAHPSLPEQFYRVGSDGTVWSCHKHGAGSGTCGEWRRLSPRPEKRNGYHAILVQVGGKQFRDFIHRLVLEVFVGPCPPGMLTRHLNGVCTDNRLENLCWGTQKENIHDQIRHGTRPRGESAEWAVLTASQVLEIREKVVTGASKASLAREYGVSPSTVRDVVSKKSWKHLP